MIDLVYILSKGSHWGDNEIRYSLRSAERHLKNFRKVFIVGYRPSFINDLVIEIPFKDVFANRSRNIMAKIHRAASDSRVTGDFILFNDDYFLLQDIDAPSYPFYYNNEIEETLKRQWNNYRFYVQATLNQLRSHEKPTKYFDLHKPIVYNKVKFRKMVAEYNWNVPHGPIVKSMYCNHFGIPGEQIQDHKINVNNLTVEHIRKINEGKDLFSISDRAMNNSLKTYLMKLYPEKSKFEY